MLRTWTGSKGRHTRNIIANNSEQGDIGEAK